MAGFLGERVGDARRAFASVFTNPPLRRLEVSWTGTICAYWIFIVTLAYYAYQHGGATAVGVVALLRVLPAVVAAPFGAGLGDRFRRERVIVFINLARSITIAAAAGAAFAGAPSGVVYALGSVMGLLQSLFRPTQAALLPLLARSPEELTAANLVLTTIDSIGVFVGPAIGGLLLAVTGVDTIFAITAGIFLIAAVLLTGVHAESVRKPAPFRGSFVREAFAGFRTVIEDSRLRLLIGLYGCQTLVAGALSVLIVVMALEVLGLGRSGIGFLNSGLGVGGLLGGFAAAALVGRLRLASDFRIGLVVAGLPIALIAAFTNTPAALIGLGLVGAGSTVVDVAGLTLLQRTIPDEVLARVMGIVQSVFVGTIGLGAVIAPALISGLGNRGALLATGAFLPAVAILAWRPLRALDAAAEGPPSDLALLRAIPIFRPLSPVLLEQLASDLEPLHVAAGQEVVRQGQRGDRFYVVKRGELEVSVDGRPGELLSDGGYFGEIALLRDVPRTATVRARTDADLLALGRDEFLSAVTGHPESSEAAHAVAAARLASLRPTVGSL